VDVRLTEIKNGGAHFRHSPEVDFGETEMAFPPDQTASDSKSSELGPRSPLIPGAREHDIAGSNGQIADKLRQAADILAAQGARVLRSAGVWRNTAGDR